MSIKRKGTKTGRFIFSKEKYVAASCFCVYNNNKQ